MATVKVPEKALQFSENLAVEFNEDDPQKAKMLGYSGKPMEHPFFGQLVVDVSGINFRHDKFPILEDHDDEKKIGFSNVPSTEKNQVYFDDITLLDNYFAKEFKKNSDRGFPYQASISFYPKKIEDVQQGAKSDVNGYTVEGPALIFRESDFRESSVVTFGMDHRTSSVAQSNENVVLNLSDKDAKLISQKIPEEFKLSSPRTPSYKGIETKSWGSVKKSFKAYKVAYGEEGEQWDDTSQEFKNWAAKTSLVGDPEADTFDEGVSYPVVNPNTGKLNKGGLLAAERYAKQQDETAIADKARSLLDKEFKKENGMTEEEIKEMQNKLQNYEAKIEDYEKKVAELAAETVRKDLEAKIGKDDTDLLMKFNDKLDVDSINEIAEKFKSYQNTINELGAPKGESGNDGGANHEPSVEEVQKYAAENDVSYLEALKQLSVKE